jgi:hypothetical protein
MADGTSSRNQRRANFRVKFPPNYTPRILIGGSTYTLIDVSEKGVRFHNPLRHRMPDDIFSATIVFHDGEPAKVVARVIRIEQQTVALYFLQGIAYKRILAEQVYVNNLGKTGTT